MVRTFLPLYWPRSTINHRRAKTRALAWEAMALLSLSYFFRSNRKPFPFKQAKWKSTTTITPSNPTPSKLFYWSDPRITPPCNKIIVHGMVPVISPGSLLPKKSLQLWVHRLRMSIQLPVTPKGSLSQYLRAALSWWVKQKCAMCLRACGWFSNSSPLTTSLGMKRIWLLVFVR